MNDGELNIIANVLDQVERAIRWEGQAKIGCSELTAAINIMQRELKRRSLVLYEGQMPLEKATTNVVSGDG